MPDIELNKRSTSDRLRYIADKMMEIAHDPHLQTDDLLPLSHQQMSIAVALLGLAEEIDDGEDQEAPVTPDQ